MKRQLELFFTALMFYTRVPVPKSLRFSHELLNRSTRYITLVGLIVGLVGAGIFYGANQVLPQSLALLLSIVATIFVTGAFHEDGFADFCDGFGGGATPGKILEIMKDSRLGTYGAIGIIGMLAIKLLSLNAIPATIIPLVIVSGHSVSRLMAVLVIFTSEYARIDATTKTKPIGKRSKISDLLIASFIGLGVFIFFYWKVVLFVFPVMVVVTWLFKKYIEKKIGGYTGDCLGALQQISEVIFYLGVLIVSNLIS